MAFPRIATLCLILFSIAGCADSNSNEARLRKLLSTCDEIDPANDAADDYSNGRRKYAGIFDQTGLTFPGIPKDDFRTIRARKDYWTIEGTSDALDSEEHVQLFRRAVNYAKKYNIEMHKLNRKGNAG